MRLAYSSRDGISPEPWYAVPLSLLFTKDLTLCATRRLLSGVLVCGAVLTVGAPAAADPAAPAVQQSDDQKKAQEHFVRARELYLGGSYKEAVAELEEARRLDPAAKDLVLNLGIVHEKLGKYDDAIGYMKRYLEMEGVTPAERTRVENMIKRIEGAKQRQVPPKQIPTTDLVRTPPAPPPPPAPGPPESPQHGRWDAATTTAAIVSGAAFATATALGLWAVLERPSDFVTGRDGTYATFEQKTKSAHDAAVASDVLLGVGLVGTIVTAALYFGRTRDAQRASITAPSFRAWAGPKGGTLGIGGAF